MNTKITENSEFSKQNAENLPDILMSGVEQTKFLPCLSGINLITFKSDTL
jgi:hypothetical protein